MAPVFGDVARVVETGIIADAGALFDGAGVV
jgi:hypothetical protein